MPHSGHLTRMSFGALAAIACAGTASAQEFDAESSQETAEAAPTDVIVYTPEDFARYAPRTALDMLEEVPGFQIEEEDDEARGLGQASGNILINGQRISSKSVSARDQIGRIPADNVIRIEIVDGATLDIPGLSGRVANIIAKSGGISGQFEWRSQYATGGAGFRWSQGDISLSGSSGRVDYTIALENPAFYGGGSGPNIITPASGPLDERFNDQKSFFDQPKLSGNFRIELGGGVEANVNLAYRRKIFRAKESEFRTSDALPDLLETFRTRNDGYEYEIGGDIAFDLGPGRLKLIALDAYETDDFLTRSRLTVDDGMPDTGSRFTREAGEGERIVRGEYGWSVWGADWQFAIEGAFNRLEQVATLSVLDAAGEYQPLPFSAGTGGVTEDRYEAILSYGRPIADNLSLQVTGGGEYSKIAQTGANALSRSFQRPKGSISLGWVPAQGLDVSFELARRVGQLSFNDFLGEVNLSDDSTNVGNIRLRPEQSWEAELEVAKDFADWGSATLTLYARKVEDFVTIVPIAGGGESPGNIDSAEALGLDLNGTWRFDPLGFSGAQLDIELQLEHSELEDPVSGDIRGFDNRRTRNLQLRFRHDVPKTDIAWGAELRASKDAPYYRVTEFGFDHPPQTFAALFVEHKDLAGLNARLRWGNILKEPLTLYRTVYAGPRDSAPILFIEDRQRELGYIVNLTLSGNF